MNNYLLLALFGFSFSISSLIMLYLMHRIFTSRDLIIDFEFFNVKAQFWHFSFSFLRFNSRSFFSFNYFPNTGYTGIDLFFVHIYQKPHVHRYPEGLDLGDDGPF